MKSWGGGGGGEWMSSKKTEGWGVGELQGHHYCKPYGVVVVKIVLALFSRQPRPR